MVLQLQLYGYAQRHSLADAQIQDATFYFVTKRHWSANRNHNTLSNYVHTPAIYYWSWKNFPGVSGGKEIVISGEGNSP